MERGSLDRAAAYSFIGCEDDAYLEVLSLRRLAYGQAGKIAQSSPLASMADEYDTRARILVARIPEGVVGSLRLMPQGAADRNEYDAYVDLPVGFAPREATAVVTRVCTHPDFRGRDLFYGLLRECYLEAHRVNTRFLLGGCTDSLLELYGRVGFRGQGLYFTHAALNGIRDQILLADVGEVVTGIGIERALWERCFRVG